MSKRQFDKVDRRPVLKDDFYDAMKQRLLAPKGEIKSETRTPSKAELALNWAVMLLVLATACVPAGAQTIGDSLVVSSSRVTVAENGDTATYTVKLSAEPGRVIAVRLEPAPAPPGLITVRPHQMLFDRRNWNIPQTVTVTGVDNDDFGDRMVTVTHTASGGKGAASVEVTIEDDELPPLPTVSLSVAPNPVVEGGSVTVTAHLSSALPSSVTIPLVLTAGTAEAGDYGALAGIAIAAGQTAATGTIGTVEDADRDDETFTVSLGMLPALVTAGSPSSVEVTIEDDDTAGSPSSVEVMIKDDDMAGIGLSPPSLHIRGCGTAAYTILLLSQPKAEVTVTVESDAPDVATTSPARLVFTPENWNRGRKVTVTTRIGGIASIVHRASSSDPGYDAASLTRTLRVVVGEGAPTLFAAPWQARFGRSHATQVLESIAGRIAAQPKAGVDGSRSIAAHREVTSSSFALTGEEVLDGSMQSVWGRSSGLHFRGRERALVLDGEVRTATVGADRWRGQSQMGLALSRGLGKGEYGGGCSGRIRASLTSVVPYASLQALERLKLWGALGYGTGKVTFRPKVGDRYKADLTWTMAVAGLRGNVLPLPEEGSGPALAVTSDALWTRTTSEKTGDLAASDSGVTRLRLRLEGSWRVTLNEGGHLTPKVKVGAHHDGGDAETGFGVDLGVGIALVDPSLGLSLNLSGRTLIAHQDGDLKDQSFAMSLAFDPSRQTRRGPSLTLYHAGGGLDTLEDRTGSGEATPRWVMEAAWGFPAFGGRFTGSPHVGFEHATAARDYTLGWQFSREAASALELSFGVKAVRRESNVAAPEHTVGFEIRAYW